MAAVRQDRGASAVGRNFPWRWPRTDWKGAGRLLERYGERLLRYDGINAARLIGDVRLAQRMPSRRRPLTG